MEFMRPEDRPQVLRGANEMLLRVLDYGETPILAPLPTPKPGAGPVLVDALRLELVGLGEPSPDLPSQEILVATIEIISATTSLDGFHLTEEAQQADDALGSVHAVTRDGNVVANRARSGEEQA